MKSLLGLRRALRAGGDLTRGDRVPRVGGPGQQRACLRDEVSLKLCTDVLALAWCH